MRRLVIMAIAALAAGCAGVPECDLPQLYHTAQPYPALQAPAGLDAPAPSPEYQVPGEAQHLAKGNYQGGGCLARPPQLVPEPVDEPEEDEED